MATYSKNDRREALDYAKRLAELANSAPNDLAKTYTYQAVHKIRRVFGFKDEEKEQDIRFWLKRGCSSLDELAAETKLPKPEISTLIKQMPDVRVSEMVSTTGGRPSTFFALRPAE